MSTYSPTRDRVRPGLSSLSFDTPGRRDPRAAPASKQSAGETRDHDALKPRKAISLKQAQRQARSTRRIRKILAAAMGVQVALIVGFATVNSLDPSVALAAASTSLPNEAVRMVNPRFTGRDAHGAPYVIEATAAVRNVRDPSRLILENPQMNVIAEGRQNLQVTATQGVYNRRRAQLDLSGAVCLKTISAHAIEFQLVGAPDGQCLETVSGQSEESNSYAFKTSQARVYINSGIAEGEEPIEGRGPMGQISAEGFAIYRDDRRLVFEGDSDLHVKGRIFQPPKLAAPPQDAG